MSERSERNKGALQRALIGWPSAGEVARMSERSERIKVTLQRALIGWPSAGEVAR